MRPLKLADIAPRFPYSMEHFYIPADPVRYADPDLPAELVGLLERTICDLMSTHGVPSAHDMSRMEFDPDNPRSPKPSRTKVQPWHMINVHAWLSVMDVDVPGWMWTLSAKHGRAWREASRHVAPDRRRTSCACDI